MVMSGLQLRPSTHSSVHATVIQRFKKVVGVRFGTFGAQTQRTVLYQGSTTVSMLCGWSRTIMGSRLRLAARTGEAATQLLLQEVEPLGFNLLVFDGFVCPFGTFSWPEPLWRKVGLPLH